MSDSKDDTGKEDAPAPSGSAAHTADSTRLSTSPTKSAIDQPQSSPPLLETDQSLPQAPSLPPSHNGNSNNNNNEVDEDNDSEAETLISSPVKKREALKTVNGPRLERIEERVSPPDGEGPTALESVKIVTAGNGDHQVNRDDAGGHADTTGGAADPRQFPDDGESDNLSEVSSVHSSSPGSSSGSSADALSEEEEGQEGGVDEQMDDNDGGTEEHDEPSNPRKRKHRESSLQANMEPPRRRRRASDAGNGQSREHAANDSGDASLSPQLRRHRRTTSAQSTWTEGGQTIETGDAKARKSTWDSDTSSETSHKHHNHKNRLTRNISRSVSTPGRPMGRDHKRHVNKYGFTRLAEACESGELDQVKEWRNKDPEQLEQREFAGNTPLQVASLNGYPEIVTYLLEQGCDAHCANGDKDTPLIDAVENGHIEVVRLLLDAGVDPLRQNLKGQQALDVVTDKTENAAEIRAALRKAIENWNKNGKSEQYTREEAPTHRPGPTKGLQFMARTYDNLLKLVSENDRTGVQEFLDARVPVDNAVVAAAARTGDTFTVSMLLAEMNPKKARQRPEKPMLAVIGTSHFDMVKFLTGVDQFNATWRHKSSGLTWYELADQRRGPNWREEKELLQRLYDEHVNVDRLSSSPVHKRENGKKRRRSPVRQRDSDEEMEDADSPEQARSRRRLVSKKVMRATSNRRSSSTSSADTALTNVDDPALNSAEASNLKPLIPRKVGRPRKTSLLSRAAEPQSKQQRSSSTRDQTSTVESPLVDCLPSMKQDPGPLKVDADIKIEEAERHRLEEEAQARRQAENELRLKAEKLAEESRKEAELKAEILRKEEETKRKDAERKAEELRKKNEQLAEERRIKKEAQIRALPSALQHVLGLTSAATQEKQKYIQRHFLPVQVVKHAELGLTADNGKPDDLWMLNYQAAAILTGASAADLLDLTVDSLVQTSLSGIRTLPVTFEQRQAMLLCLQSTNLVHALPVRSTAAEDDLLAEVAAAEKARQQIKEDRNKFMSLTALRWIRFGDFYSSASSPAYPHLTNLSFEMRFDCCLDSTPFGSDMAAHPIKAATNGLSHGSDEALAESQPLANGSHGKGLARAGPGITIFTVVQD
ncbi:hypothetical protein MBLNU459_g1649t2 [Dothideomycetes sp. NU459]